MFADLDNADYCRRVLQQELAKTEYDGASADQGWTWLTQSVVTERTEATHLLLTPVLVAGVLGPFKANTLAVKVTQLLPGIATALLQAGVNLSDPGTQKFLDQLVDGTDVSQADVDILKALGTRTVTTTSRPRFDERFRPDRWPHVSLSGEVGTESDPAIHGFPNQIDRGDFDEAWVKAGRSP